MEDSDAHVNSGWLIKYKQNVEMLSLAEPSSQFELPQRPQLTFQNSVENELVHCRTSPWLQLTLIHRLF